MMDEGYPVPGMEIRITDDDDQLLAEDMVGHIQMRGPNVTSGYYRNKEATEAVFCGGWLRTGDLGFLSAGRLSVTGRTKDIIFINGQNYYSHDLKGIRILVLDGNEAGSPSHQGGYKAYIGKQQQEWIEEQLRTTPGPFVIVSHQPIAGAQAINNATELQELFSKYSNKILICLNGHSHLDLLLRVKGVSYLHVNSASYQWVGGANKHNSYPEKIHATHPWIGHTCPYRDSVFGAISINVKTGNICLGFRINI